jgi:hypothetical protein
MFTAWADPSKWVEQTTSLIFTEEKGLDIYRCMYMHHLEVYTEPVRGALCHYLNVQPWAHEAQADENRGGEIAYAESPALGLRACVGIRFSSTSPHSGPFFRMTSAEDVFFAWKSNSQYIDVYIDASFY